MIEEKLKSKSFRIHGAKYGKLYEREDYHVIELSDALSICKQEIEDAKRQAKIEELWKVLEMDGGNIEPEIFARMNQLKNIKLPESPEEKL